MIIILCMIAAGIALGWLLRGRIHLNTGKVINVLIWALLFLLGIEVGSDDAIFSGLGHLGGEALLVATSGVAGSALLSLLLWKWVQGRKKRER